MEPLEDLESNDEQSQLKRLIAKGKEQGFLTYARSTTTFRTISSILNRSKTSST